LTTEIGTKAEQIFDDKFYESLNGVANALDNFETRKYRQFLV
jgi:hypothetical protein